MIGTLATGALSVPTPVSLGSYESIATSTVGSGGASSITFTDSGAWTGYKHLQIRLNGMFTTSGDVDSYITFNSSTSDYVYYHQVYAYGSTAYAGADTSTTNKMAGAYGYGTTYPSAAIIDILDFASTSKNKVIRTLNGVDWNTGGFVGLRSAMWKPSTPTAITSITLTPNSGNWGQYTSVALYGIKD